MKKSQPEKSKSDNTRGKSKVREFVQESRENIVEGAKKVNEVYNELYEKVEPNVSDFYANKVKPKARNIYKSGSETFEHVAQRIHGIVEDFKHDLEIRNMTHERNKSVLDLGLSTYHEFMKNGTVTKKFLTTKKIADLMDNIQRKEEEILLAGSKMEEQDA